MARYGVALLFPVSLPGEGQIPWHTLTANLLACIVLGVGLALVTREQLSRSGQLLLLTGFCGGFSTFSTFAAEILQLVENGFWGAAAVYLALSLLFGCLAILGVLWVSTSV